MRDAIQSLLILGCGYVGEQMGKACVAQGMAVYGTTRSAERAQMLSSAGIEPVSVHSITDIPDQILHKCDAVLDSVPLDRGESGLAVPQAAWLPQLASKLSHIQWAGYLSTTGVYGDAGGAWVDEDFPCNPSSERGKLRLQAERLWLESGLPAEVFRLAGIYGPGRNIVPKLMAGGYKAVTWNPPHWSSRIHVDDIVAALLAAMHKPRAGRIVNLSDDAPLPHADYVTELAKLVGAPPPELLTPEEGAGELSTMALEFFRDNKRVSNKRLHEELLPELRFPTFRKAFASSQA